jgi:hypothetical protein
MNRIYGEIAEPGEDLLSDMGAANGVRIPRMVRDWEIQMPLDEMSTITFTCILTKEMKNTITAWMGAERIKKGYKDG